MSRHPFRTLIPAGGLALLLVLAACGDDGEQADGAEPSSASGADAGDTSDDGGGDFPPINDDVSRPGEFEDFTGQSTVTVEISDNVFTPRNIRVDPGTEVIFENVGVYEHNVLPAAEGAFEPIDTDTVFPAIDGPGGSDTRLFETAGDYPYYCSVHGVATAGQTGYILVGNGSPSVGG